MAESPDDESTETVSLDNVFVDTSILLNYVQQGLEPDHTSELIEGNHIDLVVGVTVADEFDDVGDRRADIYPDFLDFLLVEEGKLTDYSPEERRPYFQENDYRHLRNIQMQLSQLDDRAEIQRQVRYFIRAIQRRIEYIREEIIPSAKFDLQPGMTLLFALGDVIPNDSDRNVVGDAALWSAEVSDSSGVFATMDRKDLLNLAGDINSALHETKGKEWELTFLVPSDLTSPTDDVDSPVAGSFD
ncbi:hypothetical protein ACOZ4L_04975 [Haloplanus ruber]|uniref:PIN domain-containing protein n=1 Tax=Haloplanus ruber TaxID=869892 RepID=A0ABD6D1L5_9EURY|nr:hypothetical protein [Haloplanus ruber]